LLGELAGWFVGTVPFPPNARVIASANPPMHNAQNIFSNGANGSWIPSKIDDTCRKVTKKIIFQGNFEWKFGKLLEGNFE
jgi:hypothetical protein